MNKRFALASALLLGLSLTATAVSAADASSNTPVTRGQFMEQVADYVQLSPPSGTTPLPADVDALSPYAKPIQALIERRIIDGYPDGTFRPDQPITAQEAGYILARFLGFEDASALARLEAKFNVRFDDRSIVLPDTAQQAIRATLANDANVREWLTRASVKQAELQSFQVDMEQYMQLRAAPGFAEMPGMETTAKSAFVFDAAKGMHTTMSMDVPGQAGPMRMEQYIVPEGSFMRISAEENAGAGWLNTTKQMPFSFELLLQLQRESASLNASLLHDSFFYRDLGTEQLDGKTMKKFELNGTIRDFNQILSALGSAFADPSMLQALTAAPELQNMSLAMNGTIWIDEATLLTAKMETSMSVRYSASEEMPLEGMDATLTAVYKAFNEPVELSLPEEAKNAPEAGIGLPSGGASESTAERAGSDAEAGAEDQPAADAVPASPVR